jgi:hypothetical protein
MLVCGVLRLRNELNRLAWLAYLELEAPSWAALVGVVGAYDREAKAWAWQSALV